MHTLALDKRYEEMKKSRDEGMTYEKIGFKYNISGQRVQQILIRGAYKKISLKNPLALSGGRDRLREEVRKRDKYTCQICGKVWQPGQRRFDVHHQDEAIMGKVNSRKVLVKYDRANLHKLTTLCHKCHLGLHWGKKISYAQLP